jgi:acyl dehydratase
VSIDDVTLYLEDLTPGRVFELGSVVVTEEAIVEFATRYDPQPFHVDPEAAADSPFGGLIASGWQTCALFMRLLVDGLVRHSAGMGSPGMDEVRWLAPVRPGDTLTATFTVADARPSSSRPDRGIVHSLCEMRNQDGVVVMTMRGMGMYGRRPTG